MDAKLKRRWFCFSLRTLLLMVAIACIGFGWLGTKVRSKQREREAIEAMRGLGSWIVYDYEFSSNDPPGPKWLRQLLGEDVLANVVDVTYFPKTSKSAFRHLSALQHLEILDVGSSQFSDTDVIHLVGLKKLTMLNLSRTQITDAGLFKIRCVAQLEWIGLIDTNVTDAGCQELQGALPNLKIGR